MAIERQTRKCEEMYEEMKNHKAESEMVRKDLLNLIYKKNLNYFLIGSGEVRREPFLTFLMFFKLNTLFVEIK